MDGKDLWRLDITDPQQMAGQLVVLRIAVQALLLGMPEPRQAQTAARMKTLFERAFVRELASTEPRPPEWMEGFDAMRHELLRTHLSTRETGRPPDLH